MENLPELAGVDDLLGEGDGGDAAVVVPHGVRHAGLLDFADHFLTLRTVEGERFFAQHHLAGARGGDGDLGVRVVGGDDVDGVDVGALDELAPVGLGGFKAPVIRVGFEFGGIAAAGGLEDGDERGVEKLRRVVVGVRVGAAHKAVADDTDVEVLFCHRC